MSHSAEYSKKMNKGAMLACLSPGLRDIIPICATIGPFIMSLEESINNLEVKLSFTEDLVDELNQTIYKQQQQIDVLINEVKALKVQMASQLPSGGHSLRDEIPPHY